MTVQEREPSRVRGRENRVKFTRANGEEGICWSGGQPSQPPALEFCDGQWARLLTLAAHSMSFHGPVAVHQSKHLLFVSSREGSYAGGKLLCCHDGLGLRERGKHDGF